MVFDVMLQITSGDVDKFYKDIELDRHGAMADPRKWSISRVIKWVKWIEKEYKISGKRFLGKKLNGDEVNSLPVNEFNELWENRYYPNYHWQHMVKIHEKRPKNSNGSSTDQENNSKNLHLAESSNNEIHSIKMSNYLGTEVVILCNVEVEVV